MDASKSQQVFNALDSFRVGLSSWTFANTGTRFGTFIQLAAAATEEKVSDSKGLPRSPTEAFRQSGYLDRIASERAAGNSRSVSSYA
jgi:L-rhamnose isomerase